MRAALYARVSDPKQKKNFSIPTQLEAMREYCAGNGLEVFKEYSEDKPGTRLEGQALDQVRVDAAQRLFDILVCHDIDRFGRNLGHQILLEEEFAKHGVEVRYVLGDYKDTPEGRLNKHIKGVIAEYEREKILERTTRGRLGRAKAGQVNVGYRRPYGYVYKSEERKGWLEVMPEEAKVVQDIYKWYVEDGFSIYKTAKKLSELKIPSVYDQPGRRGAEKEKTHSGYGEWCRGSVANILKNEVYAGTWYDNKYRYVSRTRRQLRPQEEWIPVHVPPIIPRELWEAAQERLAQNRRCCRAANSQYLLSGLLRCAKCGNVYVGQSMVGNAGRTIYLYYTCRGNTPEYKHGRCHEPRINAIEAGCVVWAKVAEGLREPQLLAQQYASWREGQPQRLEETSNRLAQVTVALDHLAKKRDRWLELYVDGEVDRKQLKEEQESIRAQQRSLEQEKRGLEAILHEAQNTEARLRAFNEFCLTVSHQLNDITFEEKQKILRLLNIQGRVSRGQIHLSGCIPSWEKQEEMFAYCPFEPD